MKELLHKESACDLNAFNEHTQISPRTSIPPPRSPHFQSAARQKKCKTHSVYLVLSPLIKSPYFKRNRSNAVSKGQLFSAESTTPPIRKCQADDITKKKISTCSESFLEML